ncbi:homoserine O-succinyltransferase [Campylobacter sp. MG1]|uniref:homoserine O-succinyltransferase n=1 Tax=Campylobacter sp. MG1 TaxID=2976332 RepID=UPI00226CE447|nr:homoserine O-succinyltransferase [Campylobacter sp. MG1]
MPLNIKTNLPAIKLLLENENIFVMDELRASSQDIRPLEILILNLMPVKEDTELELLRMLSNSPIQANIELLRIKSHNSKNTEQSHLNSHYVVFDEIKHRKFDGMIITGAPIEHLEFEEVKYIDELREILQWSRANVYSVFHICYGAMLGLYHHYGIKKIALKHKLSGVYWHSICDKKEPLLRGMDDVFLVPHSRNSSINEEQVINCKDLDILSKSDMAGLCLIASKNRRLIFVLGHPEYSRHTLDSEYKRDLNKGLNPSIPYNYYPDNNPNNAPLLTWRAASNCIYINWLNYYVYQATQYDLSKINEKTESFS